VQSFVVDQTNATQRAAQELFLLLGWVKAISVGSFSHVSHCDILPVKPSWKDGVSTHFSDEHQAQIERLVEKVLSDPILRDDVRLQQAFVAKLTEKVLGSASQENVAQIQKKRQNRGEESTISQA
jgi:hypothetical protein